MTKATTLIIVALVLMSVLIFTPGNNLTGNAFVNFNNLPDVSIEIDQTNLIIGQSYHILLHNNYGNWENYTNATITYSNSNLLTPELIQLNGATDFGWNLNATSSGIFNITIRIQNINSEYITHNFTVNISSNNPPSIEQGNINELNIDYQSEVILGDNFSINLSNNQINWSKYNYTFASVSNQNIINSTAINYNRYFSNYNNPYQDLTWNFTANNLGETEFTITILDLTGNEFNFTRTINVTSQQLVGGNQVELEITSPSKVSLGDKFFIKLSNIESNWSKYNYTYSTVIDSNIINSNNLDFNIYFSNYYNPYKTLTWNFTAQSLGQTEITITLFDILGNEFNFTRTINVESQVACPSDYYFQCASGTSALINLNSCTYDYMFTGSNPRLIFNYNNSQVWNGLNYYSLNFSIGSLISITPLYKSYNQTNNLYPLFSITNQTIGEKYNISAIVESSLGNSCHVNSILDLSNDTLTNLKVILKYENNIPTCSNVKSIIFNDTTNSNFSAISNINITSNPYFNITLKNILINHTASTIEIPTTCINPKRESTIEINYDASSRSYIFDTYEPDCKSLNLTYNSNNKIFEIIEQNPYNTGSGEYWKNYSNLTYYLIDQKYDAQVSSRNKIINTSKALSSLDVDTNPFNNETRDYNYTFLARFNTPNGFCNISNNNSLLNIPETHDPNITITLTEALENQYVNISKLITLNITNHEKNNITLSGEIMLNETNSLSFNVSLNGSNNYTQLINYNLRSSKAGIFQLTTFSIPSDFVKELNEQITFSNPIDTEGGNGKSNSSSSTTTTSTFTSSPIKKENATSAEAIKNIDITVDSLDITEVSIASPDLLLESIESVNANTQNSISTNNKITNLISNGLKRTNLFYYKDGKTIIKETLKNGNILKQYDVVVVVEIPKEIAENTDHIGGNFTVLEYDPKIMFYYETIDSGKEIVLNYTIDRELTDEQVKSILVFVNSSYSKSEIEEFEKEAEETNKFIDTKINVKKDANNMTSITTDLNPQRDLEDVKVYMSIPKCLAEHLNEIEFEQENYEVIEEDPLIAWSFEELNTPLSLEFKTLKEVPQDCWEQIVMLPIAKEIKEKLTKQTSWYFKFWPLLIIALILLIAPFVSKHANLLKKDEHKGKHFLHKDIITNLEFGFEEIALSSIILLNIMDFFEILPPDLDFVKKVISWAFLGMLMFQVDITKILFGVKHKVQDVFLILAYFGLMASDIINAFNVLYIEILESGIHSFVAPFLNILITYSSEILYTGFYGGLLIILVLTLLDFSKEIQPNSMLGAVHESGKMRWYRAPDRLVMTFLAYITFFLVFFKFFMEWFAIAVDAVIAVIGIIMYISMFFKKHHKHYHDEHFVYKIGTIGESFYEKFIEFFSDPKKIIYGLTGMLVVHLLVDLSNFIIPYIISIHDSLYFSQLATNGMLQNHTPIVPLLKSILTDNLFLSIKIITVYVLEFIAIISFLLMPAVIWYDISRGHNLKPHKFFNAIYMASIAMFFSLPLFRIEPILGKNIVGIDLLLLNIFDLGRNFEQLLYISLIVGLVALILSINKRLSKVFMIIGVVFSQIFFMGYVYSYLYSWIQFFLYSIKSMMYTHPIISYSFILFMVIITIFYIAGFLAYIDIVMNKWGKKKLTLHDQHAHIIKVLVDFIEKEGDIQIAHKKLLDAGWDENHIHEAMIETLKLEKSLKGFFSIEKYKHHDKETVRNELLHAGWDSIVIDASLKKYW